MSELATARSGTSGNDVGDTCVGGCPCATALRPCAGECIGTRCLPDGLFGLGRCITPEWWECASSATRKNVIICCSDSACAASSSAVDDSSSAADALRCVTWSTCTIARFICTTPLACSLDTAATCCTSSAVFRIDGTSSFSRLPERSGQLLGELVPSIRRTSDLVREVAAASSEQSSGVAQINRAMAQVDEVTQRNASAAEELSSTAEEMSAQAEALQALVSFFNVGASWSPAGGGASSRSAATGASHRPLERSRA